METGVKRFVTLTVTTLPEAGDCMPRARKPGKTCYTTEMVKTLEIALSKVAALSDAAQEQLGRELLERIETLKNLRAEIEVGIGELEAGLGEELDVEELLRQLHQEHAGKA
jgi:hypothetical protein